MKSNNLRVLIVEDHRLFAEGLSRLVSDILHIESLELATNGFEAIELCKKQTFDIIFMDLQLPVITGADAAIEIRRFLPEAKLIVITMMNNLPAFKTALEAGVHGYLLKNCEPEVLRECLFQVQLGKLFIDPELRMWFNTDEATISNGKSQIISPREKSILKLIVEGKTDAEIGAILSISTPTVSTHRKNMLAKTGCNNTAALVSFSLRHQLI